MPAYTHLQRAQPSRLSHHLMAWQELLWRDRGRLVDALARLNESPLGAGAVAGSGFPLDREGVARALGFAQPMHNSIDATGSRDFSDGGRLRAGHLGRAPVAHRRRDRALVDARVRLHDAERRIFDQLVDDAAEEEPGRGRARARQVRAPDRLRHDPAGARKEPGLRLRARSARGQAPDLRRLRVRPGQRARADRRDRDAPRSTASG